MCYSLDSHKVIIRNVFFVLLRMYNISYIVTRMSIENGGIKMLVSATEMLKKAKAGHYAVGQFNINNLEWTKSILLTAKELRSPVILGVSEGAGKYMGLSLIQL